MLFIPLSMLVGMIIWFFNLVDQQYYYCFLTIAFRNEFCLSLILLLLTKT